MTICPILSNKFSNIRTNGLNFNAFKDFSLTSMAFVKTEGRREDHSNVRPLTRRRYSIVKEDCPSTNSGTEKLVLEYHRIGTGVSKA